MEPKALKLEDFFEQSKIFKNNFVLAQEYIPDHFLYRDKEIKEIGRCFAELIKGNPGHIWLYGEPSTGKTHCIKKLTAEFNNYAEMNNRKVRYIYATARDKTLPRFYSELLMALNPASRVVDWNSQAALDEIIKEANKYDGVNFILDELDKIQPTATHENPINTVVGSFSRFHEQYSTFKSKYMLTIITNDIKILNKQCKKDTLSSFQSNNIFFPSYDVNQLEAIFEERVALAFLDDVISNGLIKRLSAIVKSQSSDVRTGLRILNEAGRLADGGGDIAVTDEHLERAMKNIEKFKTNEVVSKLDDSQLFLLLSVVGFQKKYPHKTPTSDILYPLYRKVSSEYDSMPLKKRYIFGEILQKLVSLGLVEKSLTSKGYKKGVLISIQITEGEDLDEILELTNSVLEKRIG